MQFLSNDFHHLQHSIGCGWGYQGGVGCSQLGPLCRAGTEVGYEWWPGRQGHAVAGDSSKEQDEHITIFSDPQLGKACCSRSGRYRGLICFIGALLPVRPAIRAGRMESVRNDAGNR